jgi:mono/diheme cytochrome c family protein
MSPSRRPNSSPTSAVAWLAAFSVGMAVVALAAVGPVAVPEEPPRNPHAADAWTLPAGEPVFPADEEAMPLRRHCQLCHSSDYISTQPRLSRKAWEANVEKMRSKYGAPIPTNAVPAIVEYLVKNHGTP